MVKNTPKVTGFLGNSNKPLPVSDAEIARIVGQIQEGVDSPRPMITFEIGETVKVIDGPFQSFNGTVESCLLYTSPSPRDKRQSRMPSSA